MGISTEEFEKIIARPNKTPYDYKNIAWLMKLGVAICRMLGIEDRNMR